MNSRENLGLKQLPYEFAKEKQIVLIEDEDKGSFILFCVEEPKFDLYQEITRFLNVSFEVQRCTEAKFSEYLTQCYEKNKLSDEFDENIIGDFDIQSLADDLSKTQDLLSGQDDAPIIKLINGVIANAIKLRASDIHFEPFENSLVIRQRIDGLLKNILTLDARLSSSIISRLKIIAKLDISERRLPQDGRISLSLGEKKVDVRVSTLPSPFAERVVLRLLDKQGTQIGIDDLGLPTILLKQYKDSLSCSEGIVLVTGPTGSGKTTTLYAGLRHIMDTSKNILTVEDPIEYTLDGIGQTQVNAKTGYTFAKGLRAILRQDPDKVMLGEIRDEDTARIAIQASLTGHLVLSTVHTNHAVGAITRLRDIGIESYLLASSLELIIAQRLIRRLCETCKVQETVSATLSDLFSLDKNEVFYAAKGCAECGFTGYKGRIAIAESFKLTEEIKDMIHEEASEQDLKKVAFSEEDSIENSSKKLLYSGTTSIEELLRLNLFKKNR